MSSFEFYVKNICRYLIPKFVYELLLNNKLNSIKLYDKNYVLNRVNYYNKLSTSFNLDDTACTFPKFSLNGQPSKYFYDFREYIVYFKKDNKFRFIFEDIVRIPDIPTFVKSRKISDDNGNSVLLKLDKLRHYRLVEDRLNFDDKLDMAVFRGPCYQKHRQDFILNNYNLPKSNFGDTRKSEIGKPHSKEFMSIREQLKYKYIVSVEGNDVATNLKWIMNSNSLCFMRKPQVETWFMEGALIPNYHYVLLNDDYSDLLDKINYYNDNPEQAKEIIKNANEYINQFKDKNLEDLISLMVMKKYFDLQKGC